MLVIEGESDAQITSHNEVEVYNTKSSVWEKFPSLKAGRHGTGAAEINGKFYIVARSGNRGGRSELNSIKVLEIRD